MPGQVITGKLSVEGLDSVEDHYSLFAQVLDAVVEAGWCSEEEYLRGLKTIVELELEGER